MPTPSLAFEVKLALSIIELLPFLLLVLVVLLALLIVIIIVMNSLLAIITPPALARPLVALAKGQALAEIETARLLQQCVGGHVRVGHGRDVVQSVVLVLVLVRVRVEACVRTGGCVCVRVWLREEDRLAVRGGVSGSLVVVAAAAAAGRGAPPRRSAGGLGRQHVAVPGRTRLDHVAAPQTRPALALLGGDALRQTGEAVHAAALGHVRVGDVGCRGADDATAGCRQRQGVGFGRGRGVLVAVADGAGAFGEEGQLAGLVVVFVIRGVGGPPPDE